MARSKMIALMILSVSLLGRGHAYIKDQFLMHSTFGAGGAAGTCQGIPAAVGQACHCAGWAAAHTRRHPHCLHPHCLHPHCLQPHCLHHISGAPGPGALTYLPPPACSLQCLTQLCLPDPLSLIYSTSLQALPQLPFTDFLCQFCRHGVSLHTLGYDFFICVIILQAAERGLTPRPPPGLARPSGPVSPSSNTTGGSKGNASLSSGMPTPNTPAVGSPQSQAGQQFQGTRGSAPALAAAARGGFGSGLKPEMLKRLGNGDGNPFGEHASRPDRGPGGDRQADTNRAGLSNNVQTTPSSLRSIGSGGSNRGGGRGRGRHATAGGHSGGRQQPPSGGRL